MTVFFIGAGPGDPDLITVKGQRLIHSCPVIIYAGSLVLLDLSQRLGGGELHAKFQRGETMVSALWAVVALGLLAFGLSRGSKELRYAGLALLGLALAKLFLFDLSQLSSLTRAASPPWPTVRTSAPLTPAAEIEPSSEARRMP